MLVFGLLDLICINPRFLVQNVYKLQFIIQIFFLDCEAYFKKKKVYIFEICFRFGLTFCFGHFNF